MAMRASHNYRCANAICRDAQAFRGIGSMGTTMVTGGDH